MELKGRCMCGLYRRDHPHCEFTGKIRHKLKHAKGALAQAKQELGSSADNLEIYKCHKCGGYHLGRSKKSDVERLIQYIRKIHQTHWERGYKRN